MYKEYDFSIEFLSKTTYETIEDIFNMIINDLYIVFKLSNMNDYKECNIQFYAAQRY